MNHKESKTEQFEEKQSRSYWIKTGYGRLVVMIFEKDGKPVSLIATIGKCGSSITAESEGISRLAKLCLENKVDISKIYRQLAGIKGSNPQFINKQIGKVHSISDGVAKCIAKYMKANKIEFEEYIDPDEECGVTKSDSTNENQDSQ